MIRKLKKIMSKILGPLLFAAVLVILVCSVITKDLGRVIVGGIFMGVGFVILSVYEGIERKIKKKLTTKAKITRADIIQDAKRYSRNRVISYFLLDLFVDRHSFRRTRPYEKDLNDIIAFDKYIRRGESVYIPQMRTEEGKKLWKQYIEAFIAERSEPVQTDGTTDEEQESLPAGYWLCTCGRENPDYTSTCVCGVNKRDALNIPQ